MSSRILPNTVAVLLVTLLTTVAVFGIVSAVELPASLAAQTSTADTSLTCPATGCSAVSCHAASGAATGSAAAGSSELQTCPATGCTSYGCHATDGGSVGRPGGHGFGHGREAEEDDGLET